MPEPVPTHRTPLQKLHDLEDITDTPLVKITSVFPFTLFPSIVTVDRTKVTIVESYFFFSSQVKSFMIKDIATVTLEEGALFAKIIIVGFAPQAEKLILRYVWKEEAKKLRRLLEGLMIAIKENVDVFKINDQELLQHLGPIGKANI